MENLTIQGQMIQKMNDKKMNKTTTITQIYAITAAIYIVLGVLFFNVMGIIFIGLPFIIISIGLAANYKHSAAIILGIMGQAFISLPLFYAYFRTFFNPSIYIEPSVYIGMFVCFIADFVVYPLLYIYRKEGKTGQPEQLMRYRVIGNLKQYLQEKKMARQEKKQKTPIITGLYILLTIIFIILGVSTISLFLFTSIGLGLVIYSIYCAIKFKHNSAIGSGLIGQIIIIFLLNSFLTALPSSDPNLNLQVYSVIISISVIICLLDIFIIYPLLYIYRKEGKTLQIEKMTREQAIAYIKEISNYEDSILLNDISKNTEWRGEELTLLIEMLILNGELTAEIRDNKLLFNREAFLALSEASEEATTEVVEQGSLEDEVGEVEANTASKEIAPIKDKKGKPLKNVVAVNDIEKVLSVEEWQELQQTEAEMGIEEMQINCIVHKGPVEGTNVYICPKCKTFYCVRCAKAVKKNGEKCWTCKSELTL